MDSTSYCAPTDRARSQKPGAPQLTSSPDKSSNRNQQAFTLIELLVVISIIAILIGILLPALSAARSSAQLIKCGTQIKQLGAAVFLYVEDYNDFFPNPHAGGGVNMSWDDLLVGYDGRGSLSEAILNKVPTAKEFGGLSATALWRCPSDPGLDEYQNPISKSTADGDLTFRSYHHNTFQYNNGTRDVSAGAKGLASYSSAQSLRITPIIMPSRKIMIYDYTAEDSMQMGNAANWSIDKFDTGASGVNRDKEFLWPHKLHSMDVTFVDGHVEFINFFDTLAIVSGSTGDVRTAGQDWPIDEHDETQGVGGTMWDCVGKATF